MRDEYRYGVVGELRGLAQGYADIPAWNVIACGELPHPIDDALHACGLGRAVHASEICDRLADLIEPEPERTCRMKYDHVHCDYVCTNCGEWHDTGMYDACDADDVILLRPYKYCPNCGAKVVDE